MTHDMETWLRAFLRRVGGRAAGLWKAEKELLVRVALVFASDMPDEVITGFREATQRVPLDRAELGIVKAALERSLTISTVRDGPEGSRMWLLRFGADCSCALPLLDGEVMTGVLSVALPETVKRSGVLRELQSAALDVLPHLRATATP